MIKKIPVYYLKINLLDNNLIATITKTKTSTIYTFSCGCIGFKGANRGKGFAFVEMAKRLKDILKRFKIKYLILKFCGRRRGRRAFLKNFDRTQVKILRTTYNAKLTHNGCRKKKKRRK